MHRLRRLFQRQRNGERHSGSSNGGSASSSTPSSSRQGSNGLHVAESNFDLHAFALSPAAHQKQKERAQHIKDSVAASGSAMLVVPRDELALVNVRCESAIFDRARPASSLSSASTPRFQRIASTRRASGSISGAVAAAAAATAADTIDAAAPSTAPVEAAEAEDASGATPPCAKHLEWSQSRRALESRLQLETKASAMLTEPDQLSEQERLRERLWRLQLEMRVARGDGNCQFRSISEQLFGSQDKHELMRRVAVEHMRNNREEFGAFLGEDFESYVEGMAAAGTWGDELTLRAISDAIGIAINLITSEQHNWLLAYRPKQLKTSQEIFLTYIAPLHYNSVRRQASVLPGALSAAPSSAPSGLLPSPSPALVAGSRQAAGSGLAAATAAQGAGVAAVAGSAAA